MKLSRIFLVCLVVCVVSVQARAESPESALKQVQQAIDTSDMNLFERHVAVDSLLDQGTTVVIKRLQTQKTDVSGLPPALALMASSVQNPDMAKSIKNLLQSEMKNFIRYGITSGHFAGKSSQTPPQGLIAPLLADASTGRKTLAITGKVRRDGADRIVPVTIHDGGNGRDYRLDLRLVPEGDSWKVTQIANIDKLVSRIHKEASE